VKQGQIRIISGMWRGRKLTVPHFTGLRPTPDRVRETVFNWLQPLISGAYCLDMFAGSGALGFEALSRGAAYVSMVDQAAKVVELLRQELANLGAKNAEIYVATAPRQLKRPEHPFDIVFMDPPFAENLLIKSCAYLEENAFLAETAYIYLEANKPISQNELPSNWEILKSKKAGQVAYHLVLRKRKEIPL
jgi:16S rRNA (guanine966-N2)-methyltransferase